MRRFRIFCEDGDGWQEVVQESAPTECPLNPAHVVRAGSVVIVKRPRLVLLPDRLASVQAGATEVIANDRPSIEVVDGVTAFGATTLQWPLKNGHTFVVVDVHFVLKQAGTGTKVRIGAKVKAQAIGEDSTQAFTPSGFVVVPVTHTTIGEVFSAKIVLDASGVESDDSVAVHVGRDGNSEMGAGDIDDVSVPIQIIDAKLEAI
jgi:hypothetical protein